MSNEGTTCIKSKASTTFALSISSALITDTATGTSWRVFSVLVAVVMISSISPDCANELSEKMKIKHKDKIYLYLYIEIPL